MQANYCQRCGNALAAGASFCANCGAAQGPPMGGAVTNVGNCPNCGRSDPGDGLFCTGCRQFLVAPPGVYTAGLGRRVAAWFLDIVLVFPYAIHRLPDLVVDCTRPWTDARKTVAGHTRCPRRRNSVRLGVDVPSRVRSEVLPGWHHRFHRSLRWDHRFPLGLLGQRPPSRA